MAQLDTGAENMKEIKYGKKNDAFLFAVQIDGKYSPLSKDDLKYQAPDTKIFFDSGIYPSITDVEQYICNQVTINT
jgi:hypothetical protein